MDIEHIELIDNQDRKRYQLAIDEKVAFVEYIKTKQQIYLTHTEVPDSLEGKGVGSSLVLKTLQEVEKLDLQLVPLCPFIASYIKRHLEWRRLVMKGININ
jgi:predicted GNAT family acetyltransferase